MQCSKSKKLGPWWCLDDDGQKIMPSTFQLHLSIYYRKLKCFIKENPILNIILLFGSKYSHIKHALPKDLNEEILISNELEYFVNNFANGCSHVNRSHCCPLRWLFFREYFWIFWKNLQKQFKSFLYYFIKVCVKTLWEIVFTAIRLPYN
jgi:hypothetical protein